MTRFSRESRAVDLEGRQGKATATARGDKIMTGSAGAGGRCLATGVDSSAGSERGENVITDDCDKEMQLIAGAIAADEARSWARPSVSARIRAWFIKTYGDAIARRRHAVEEEARSLGAKQIIWDGSDGCEIVWRPHG
jgi:hypothetical protein